MTIVSVFSEDLSDNVQMIQKWVFIDCIIYIDFLNKILIELACVVLNWAKPWAFYIVLTGFFDNGHTYITCKYISYSCAPYLLYIWLIQHYVFAYLLILCTFIDRD